MLCHLVLNGFFNVLSFIVQERKSIDIGDEDEFVLVGNRTQARPDGYVSRLFML